jgi:hypothetical protein
MTEIIDRLVRYLVSCAKAFELDAEHILVPEGQERHQGAWGHENYKYAAGAFLALYCVEHPLNPHYREKAALERYLRLAGGWVSRWEAGCESGEPVGFAEWPPLMVARGLDKLGDELDDGTRARWEKFVTHFAEHVVPQPFFFTAPNHEAWKMAVAALAGRVLKRPDLTEVAAFKARQLMTYQTPEGFWEEGRHHGPSMKYNSLMLAAMAIVAKETGDAEIRDSAARLASFMARWCFPDGVLAGVFDGRQCTSPGYFGRLVPGLELAPEGIEHMARIMDFWERAGWLDQPRMVGPSNWYTHFGMPFPAEALFYFSDLDLGPPRASLPLDGDGAVLENHACVFDGVMNRQGPWVTALSAQISDVPKDTQFIYRLERQSRIEIWHRKSSVVLGGGQSLVNCVWPLYNVWAESGWGEKPSENDYAHTEGIASSPEYALRRSKYYAKQARSGADGARTWLEVVFAHCTLRFDLQPAGDEMVIAYSYRQLGLEELRLAMPMLVWRSGKALVGGEELPADARVAEPVKPDVAGRFVVETPLFDSKATLTLPEEGASRVIWPLEPVRTYGQLFDEENFSSFFRIALVETVIEKPEREGSGEWRLRVE